MRQVIAALYPSMTDEVLIFNMHELCKLANTNDAFDLQSFKLAMEKLRQMEQQPIEAMEQPQLVIKGGDRSARPAGWLFGGRMSIRRRAYSIANVAGTSAQRGAQRVDNSA